MSELKRLRDAFRSACSVAEGRHPADETWYRLAADELSVVEKAEVLDHVLECPRCADIHRALLELRRGAHDFDPGAPMPAAAMRRTRRRWTPRMWLVPGAVATAAAALILGVALIDRSGPIGDGSARPDHTVRSAARADELRPLEPVGLIRSRPAELSWQAPDAASVFVVELLDGSGELLWTSDEVAAAAVTLPADLDLPDGRYYWRVHSFGVGPDAEQVSELVAFDLRTSRR